MLMNCVKKKEENRLDEADLRNLIYSAPAPRVKHTNYSGQTIQNLSELLLVMVSQLFHLVSLVKMM